MAVVVPPLVYPVPLFIDLVAFAFDRAGAPRLNVTSWYRAGDPRLHGRGLALDLQGSFGALQAMGFAWRSLGLDAIDEAPAAGVRVNPVLHIELDGPVLRMLGVDFR